MEHDYSMGITMYDFYLKRANQVHGMSVHVRVVAHKHRALSLGQQLAAAAQRAVVDAVVLGLIPVITVLCTHVMLGWMGYACVQRSVSFSPSADEVGTYFLGS